MHRPLAMLIALLPLALVPAASAQDGPEASASSGYTVRGTVINAVTNQPVARALVSLAQDQAVLTGSNGQFTFDNVAAGSYSVSVGKPGFQGIGAIAGISHPNMLQRSGRSSRMPQQIQVGPDMAAVTLPITPLAMITGRVTLSSADPADGIGIQVFGRQIQNGHPHWQSLGQTRTRSDGSFRIANLEPGSYRLSTMASLDRPGSAFNARAAVWGYPSLYYPGTTDISGAGILTLGAGQQAEADITVVRQQFFPVVGIVHSSSGTPASFEILDSGGRQTGLFARFDRRDGTVHAVVPNGTWTLEARVYGQSMEWGSTTFQVSGAPASVAINLQPIPHIPIVVRRDLSSSSTTQPGDSGPGMNIELINADEMRAGAGGGMSRDDNSGSPEWHLNINEPGRYWIQAQAFPPTYISSVTSGGVDLGSNPLAVVPGSTPAAVEVTLRDDGGTISGAIKSQTPGGNLNPVGQMPRVWVYAIPLFSTATALRNVMPNSDGHFSFYAMAPGSYRLVACDAPQEIDFHSAEGLAAWAGKGETVSVDAGGTASAELDVLHIASEEAQ